MSDIEQLFGELQELTMQGREERLAELAVQSPGLHAQIIELLKADEQAGSFLHMAGESTVKFDGAEQVGKQIRQYKLREMIGEGGMGAVYVAEQEKPLRRKVALKVIKPGMDSKAVLARFDAERNALALMSHPNIARVLDAGTTSAGRPYFVMELVNGQPITEYCDAQKLTIRERLGLFVEVCQAIQHAHQKGIIHRDIKPSNVLVTELDGKPVAKVIDFGVAKALNQSLTEQSIYTAHQAVIGTPLYMSPEQASFSAVDVDTRSDVYSLGVLLYELLTGTTPFTNEDLKQAAQNEVFQIIREREPPRPSNRISSLGETVTQISSLRRTQPDQLGRTVRGDLDWIVMKALSKERGRRYDSATRLEEDVVSHLKDEPVSARPPSAVYKINKSIRKHRQIYLFATSTAVLMLVSIVGLWSSNSRLTSLNQELRTRLVQIRELATDRLMDAAFSGDLEATRLAVELAIDAEAPSELIESLDGIALLLDGQSEEAIEKLEALALVEKESPLASAALCLAYLQTGAYGLHESTQLSVQEKLSANDDPYAEMFQLMTVAVDGTTEALQARLAQLDQLVSRKRHWGIARLARSRILAELATHDLRFRGEGSSAIKKFSDAISEFRRARQALHDSSMVMNYGPLLLVKAIEASEHVEGKSRLEWKVELDNLLEKLGDSRDQALAMHAAIGYLCEQGEKQRADELEQFLIETFQYGTYPYAAEIQRFDPTLIPEAWSLPEASIELQLCYAMALACDSPTPAKIDEIRSILFERVFAVDQAVAWFTLAADIPCVLGKSEMLRELCARAKTCTNYKSEWLWFTRYVQFMSGELSEEDCLKEAGPFSHIRSGCYYAVGMKALLERNIPKANEFFAQAENCGYVTTFPYHNSKLFREKLAAGWLQGREGRDAVEFVEN